MITIKRHNQGFKAQFKAPGTGMKSFTIQGSLAAIHSAIDHYYGDAVGHHDGQDNPECPLCQSRAKRLAEYRRAVSLCKDSKPKGCPP